MKNNFDKMVAYDFGDGIGNNNCFSCDGSISHSEPIFDYKFSDDDAIAEVLRVFNENPDAFARLQFVSTQNYETGYDIMGKEYTKGDKHYIGTMVHYLGTFNSNYISATRNMKKPTMFGKCFLNKPLIHDYYVELSLGLHNKKQRFENETAKQMFDIIHNHFLSKENAVEETKQVALLEAGLYQFADKDKMKQGVKRAFTKYMTFLKGEFKSRKH